MSSCTHNEWLCRVENSINFLKTDNPTSEVRLTCRICFRDVEFPNRESIPEGFTLVGSIEDPPKRILFVHSIQKGTTHEELQFHLNLFCNEDNQIEKIVMNTEQQYAFVQIRDPRIAARLVGLGKFLDTPLKAIRITYAKNQSPLLTKSIFLVIDRVCCGQGGMLPITPLLLFQIFYHFSNIRKVITLGQAGNAPLKQTKALIELASCKDAEAALNHGPNLRVELEGHDVLEIHISVGKNEAIQNSTNSPSSMVITEENERMLRWQFPQLPRSLVISSNENQHAH